MKYLIILLFLVGCSQSTPEMEKYRKELDIEIKIAQGLTENLKQTIKRSREELNQLEVDKAIKKDTALYIVELELSQSHFTLDIGTHMADSMNTTTFELAVDKRLYDKLTVGQSIKDEFRGGSLLMKGSFGNWNVRVTDKKIKATE